MRKSAITLFVGILLLGIPMVYTGKPVKNTDLYLCIGQSNMAGRGKLSPVMMDTMQNAYLLNAEDQFELAVNPLNRYSTIGRGPTGEYLGLVYSFAKAMVFRKHPVGLIVNARGDTSIRSWSKSTEKTGGPYYNEALHRTKEAMKYGEPKAIIWHQGEADCQHPEGYKKKIIKLMTDLYNDSGIPDLPVIVGQLAEWNWTEEPYIPEGTKPFNDMIKDISSFPPSSACVSPEGLKSLKNGKDPHSDADSQIILDRRYVEAAKRLLKK